MIKFKAVIEKLGSMGEKTGWRYVAVSGDLAARMHPSKKSFRVKGFIDKLPVEGLSLLPMGNGDFILPLNSSIRKQIRKEAGATVHVAIEHDPADPQPPPELLECLADEPLAADWFSKLPKGHRNYFIKWISSAKTAPTKAKRIAMAIEAFLHQQDFGAMLRAAKKDQPS